MRHIELSVVIPVYNSQDSISVVVENLLRQYTGSFEMEIILVNDGSVDRSNEICLLLARQNSNVILLDLERNHGQQAAILKGLNIAQGDYIALMDDDMQNPPEELIKLINKIHEGFDVVIGQRITYNQTIFRRFISHLNNLVINWLLRSEKRIYFSNFLIMKKFISAEILKKSVPNANIHGLIFQITKSIVNTPTEHKIRKNGKSNYTLFKLLKYWFNVLPYLTTRLTRVLLYVSLSLIAGGVIYLLISGVLSLL
ncbi:glycosyltransferase family 2 protein [Paenibacillus sp. NPDC057934]|uniref:glycosyltransferase family 2 protein n=1 Tax=Paenibacillus sp. NPDC057934 TaxID=3346282 RepID=UPI0036DD4BA9